MNTRTSTHETLRRKIKISKNDSYKLGMKPGALGSFEVPGPVVAPVFQSW